MRSKVKIHLPNDKVYNVVMTEEHLKDDHVTRIRNLFGNAESVNIEVELEPVESKRAGMKSKTLVLWGEFLKNSYITIEQF